MSDMSLSVLNELIKLATIPMFLVIIISVFHFTHRKVFGPSHNINVVYCDTKNNINIEETTDIEAETMYKTEKICYKDEKGKISVKEVNIPINN